MAVHHRQKCLGGPLPPAPAGDGAAGEDLPGGGDFAGALEDREEVLALHRLLHTLPEPYKEVFGLRVFGELPFRAIGQVFGKTEGWARVTYYRAKSRILRQWEAERDESEL